MLMCVSSKEVYVVKKKNLPLFLDKGQKQGYRFLNSQIRKKNNFNVYVCELFREIRN